MQNDHAFACGPTTISKSKTASQLHVLNIHGLRADVHLKVQNISKRLVARVPDKIADLLEIASYVYAADQTVRRGGSADRGLGDRWHRSMTLVIPVRRHAFWNSDEITGLLSETLSFLSGEDWRFDFRPFKLPPPVQEHFDFGEDWPPRCDSVCLFSGGLDSFGGAVRELKSGKKNIALVSHRSNPKTAHLLKLLVAELQRRVPETTRITHVPVWASKSSKLTHESTQRTRSFLYASLGIAVASILKSQRLEVYENGVVTINLPISAQLIGARATRSTHPCVLSKFSELFTKITSRKSVIENGFLWQTKTDIVREIRDHGFGDLIRYTESCGGTFRKTKLVNHCGHCSQCIDRRFAVLAAEAGDDDPSEMYDIDLLEGERAEGPVRTMAESYVRTARECADLDPVTFFERFPEANKAVACLNGTADESAGRIQTLYNRHGEEVVEVLTKAIQARADALAKGNLPESCILMMTSGQYASAKTSSLKAATEYCKVITNAGTRHVSRSEYERLIEQSSEYDMFVDGLTRRSEIRSDSSTKVFALTVSEFAMLVEVVDARRAISPVRTTTGSGLQTSESATKLFERARRKVDTKSGRYGWKAFKTRKVAPGSNFYEFDPPGDFRFCLVVPLRE